MLLIPKNEFTIIVVLFLLRYSNTDINECSANTHDCSYQEGCQNTQGSYRCTCDVGYYLDDDQRTCKGKSIYKKASSTHCVNNISTMYTVAKTFIDSSNLKYVICAKASNTRRDLQVELYVYIISIYACMLLYS